MCDAEHPRCLLASNIRCLIMHNVLMYSLVESGNSFIDISCEDDETPVRPAACWQFE